MRRLSRFLSIALFLAAGIFSPAQTSTGTSADKIVAAAHKQIGVTLAYDPAYVSLAYPGGDVPIKTGVCTDVVVRALRTALALDLQKAVHEDMRAHFSSYPQRWGLKAPDKNIDHRRVPNLATYFKRHHRELHPWSDNPKAYLPGDIVTWDLGGGILHIGIVSKKNAGSRPLVIHNIGRGAREEDILFTYEIIGHYRIEDRS